MFAPAYARLGVLAALVSIACGSPSASEDSASSSSESFDAEGGPDADTESDTTGATSGSSTGDGDCDPALPVLDEAPALLSEAGLYSNASARVISDDVREYAPQFPLWTDGAQKRRWIYLPGCEQIDTSDMDFWSFPVGTRAFKEFVVSDAGGDLLIETRMIARTGPEADDFIFAAYRWNDAETEATLLLDGEDNLRGTQHDIPDEGQCRECHGTSGSGGSWGDGGGDAGGTPSRFLGFGAIQLSHDGEGLNLLGLISQERLSHPPAGNFVVPDSPDGSAAPVLGNFHGNCGHCHNTSPDGLDEPSMDLLLSVNASSVETSGAYLTTVNVPSEDWQGGDRIRPGDPQASEVYTRDAARGPNSDQMPPLGTEFADDEALAELQAWICSLAPCE